MYTDSEDVHVTKLLDIVTSIPKQLSLHFSDFSTNFINFRTDYDCVEKTLLPLIIKYWECAN